MAEDENTNLNEENSIYFSIHNNTANSGKNRSDPFTTSPNYKSKYVAFDQTAIKLNTTHSHIPLIADKPEKYKPIPYVFRIPDISINRTVTATARCPPFYIQLDHAIAVVWSLYSKEETAIPLGINQLQWACSFLNNIRNVQNSHPPDISHCMEAISNELIEQYADLVDDVHTRQSLEESFAFGAPLANSTGVEDAGPQCICGQAQNQSKPPEITKGKCTSNEPKISCKEPEVTFPFSFTYNDMKSHQSVGLSSRSSGMFKETKVKKKKICNEETDVSTVLNDWRKDQLRKILGELDRLHSIEQYIEISDNDRSPCMDDEDKEMQEYITRKLASCTNTNCQWDRTH